MGAADYHGVDVETRKRLGIYYTPMAVAEVLVEWALPAPGPVIDPSFGGCNFLTAALERLEALGVPNAPQFVHGVDIDEVGARFSAATVLERGVPTRNIHFGDFFEINVPAETERYAAVVGNPPYIRSSAVDKAVSASARRALETARVDLPRAASLWAPFTAHSVQHVRSGGRLAFLLPSSLLHAAYSRTLLKWICRKFDRVRLIEIEEAVFSGVQEETIVMACEGRGGETATVEYDHIMGSAALRAVLSRPGAAQQSPSTTGWRRELAPPDSLAVLAALENTPDHFKLGDCCDIRIGVVTGANAFFLRSYDRREGRYLRPVVRRTGWLKSPVWTNDDVAQRRGDSSRSWLLTLPKAHDAPEEFREAITQAERDKLHERSHCLRRDPWWALSEVRAPDAFLPYMNAGSPSLIKNATRETTCTNAVHRLYWKNRARDVSNLSLRDALIASSWTSAFGLAAELFGRRYGGGVLKLEPSEAVHLPLFAGCQPGLLDELDALARRKGASTARATADRIVLGEHLGLGTADINALAKGITVLQAHRGHTATFRSGF